ncbi:hypothetical protein [Streptomyces sp. NPDC058434]|uniref:hypothetical protein n=1 Tax=Streptomyces sp. NPDC058434 TaxID=3346498 RepID=UPI00365A9EF6
MSTRKVHPRTPAPPDRRTRPSTGGLDPGGPGHPECPCGVFAADTDDNAAGNILSDQVAGFVHETVRKLLVDEAFKDQLVMHGAGLGIDLESVERNPQELLP